MRRISYNTFVTALLILCSTLFVSCEAITAQNINTDSFGGGLDMNGGLGQGPGGVNNNPGMNGGPGRNSNQIMKFSKSGSNRNTNFIVSMMNADLMGKILSVDGNSIEVELIEAAEDNNSLTSNAEKQNVKDNLNNGNNNSQSQKHIQMGMPNMNFTGTYQTITVNDDVAISESGPMNHQNENNTSKSSIKVSDLKKDEIIMVWYKENTETIERISIVQP